MPHTVERDPERGTITKLIDVAQADAWRAANVAPRVDSRGHMRGVVDPGRSVAARRRGETPPAPPKGMGHPSAAPQAKPTSSDRVIRMSEARSQTAEIDLELRRTRLDAARGALVSRAGAEQVARTFAAAVGVMINRMAEDSALTVASALGSTEHEAFLALRKVAQRLREDLAQTMRQATVESDDRAVG